MNANRFVEPSSFAGYACLAQTAKLFLPPAYHLFADGLSALFGSMAVAKREGR